MPIRDWSQTPSANASADSTINYAEGQTPGSLNDAGRAAMAAVAEWRDDLNGTLTTGGTGTAYTLTTNQDISGEAANVDGFMVVCKLSADIGSSATLAVDSQAAKPITYKAGTAVPSGALKSGQIVALRYIAADNSGEWRLIGPFQAQSAQTAALTFVIDGGGQAITTGIKGDIEVPFACTVTAARAFADQTGSIVVDIWKDTYANFPPTDADSITASAPVTISSATKSQDTTLSGWTTSVSAGDILRFNVDSVSTVQRVTISLTVTKS